MLFIYNSVNFWFILGFMIYLAGSFFIYVFANQIDKADLHNYWFITFIFNSIKNVLFSIAFLLPDARKETSTNENLLKISVETSER